MYIDLRKLVPEWTHGRFTLDSAEYAGRLPQLGDLNSEILEQIYQGLRSEGGPEAARNYVRFVAKLEDLSASSFVVALERFAYSDFTEVNISQHASDRSELSSGDEMFTQGLISLNQFQNSGMPNQEDIKRASFSLKFMFVRSHHNELPEDEREAAFAF